MLLEFAEAGVGSRAVAFMLDLLARIGIILAVSVAIVNGLATMPTWVPVTLFILLGFAVLIVYPVAFELLANGQTPGKMALGLRVVTVEGAPVRIVHSSVRAALGMVDFFMSLGAVAVFSALFSRRSQRLGDVFAGTIVVRERSATKTAGAVAFQPPHGWEQFATRLDTSALNTEIYILVRDFLLRVHDLRPEQRRRLSALLADRVARRLGLPRTNTYPEAFLVAVAAAYQKERLPTTPSGSVGAPPVGSAGGPAAAFVRPEGPVVAVEDLPATWGTP